MLLPRVAWTVVQKMRLRSLDFEDAVSDPTFDEVAGSDADDVVQPRVWLLSRFEEGVGAKVVTRWVDLEPLHGIRHVASQLGWRDPTTAVSHVDQCTVVCLEGQTHIERHRAVGSEERPVAAARKHRAAKPGPFERSARGAEQHASSERAIAEVTSRIKVNRDVEQMGGLDLRYRLDP